MYVTMSNRQGNRLEPISKASYRKSNIISAILPKFFNINKVALDLKIPINLLIKLKHGFSTL
ncbi:hypothetical protein HanIR_Chr10g0494951 [Helianthus annuus]|nr:hypothetical protein HanIR_Chr10g0494951 [Helianthus annuus]